MGLWIVATFNTYLIFFQIKYMKGDFFVNTIVSAASDITAYAAAGYFMDRMGLKSNYLTSFVVCVIGATMYIFLRVDYPSLIPVFLLVSNFGTSWCVNIDWNANAKLFPVIYASSTNGICNLFARVTNSLAPQFAEFEQPLPIIIFGGMCLAGAIICLFLQEQQYEEGGAGVITYEEQDEKLGEERPLIEETGKGGD
jgi:hypothetical protein